MARMPGIIDPRYSKAFFSSALLSWLSSIFNHWRRIAWKFSLADCPLWRFGWWRALRTFLCGLSLEYRSLAWGHGGIYNTIMDLVSLSLHTQEFYSSFCWWRSVIVFVRVMGWTRSYFEYIWVLLEFVWDAMKSSAYFNF